MKLAVFKPGAEQIHRRAGTGLKPQRKIQGMRPEQQDFRVKPALRQVAETGSRD